MFWAQQLSWWVQEPSATSMQQAFVFATALSREHAWEAALCHRGLTPHTGREPGSNSRVAPWSPDTQPEATEAHWEMEEGWKSKWKLGLCTEWGTGTDRFRVKLVQSKLDPHCPSAKSSPGSPPSSWVWHSCCAKAARQHGRRVMHNRLLALGELSTWFWGPSHHRGSLKHRHGLWR